MYCVVDSKVDFLFSTKSRNKKLNTELNILKNKLTFYKTALSNSERTQPIIKELTNTLLLQQKQNNQLKMKNSKLNKTLQKYRTTNKKLIENKTAAKLSVTFMKELVTLYSKTLKDLPKGLKRQLLKTNAFNKKILRMFKKGLRNIELGLPIE